MTFEFDIPFSFSKLSIQKQDEILDKFYTELQSFSLEQAKQDEIVKTIGDMILKMRIEELFENTLKTKPKPKTKKNSKKQENEENS